MSRSRTHPRSTRRRLRSPLFSTTIADAKCNFHMEELLTSVACRLGYGVHLIFPDRHTFIEPECGVLLTRGIMVSRPKALKAPVPQYIRYTVHSQGGDRLLSSDTDARINHGFRLHRKYSKNCVRFCIFELPANRRQM